jgi:hypothetical protein
MKNLAQRQDCEFRKKPIKARHCAKPLELCTLASSSPPGVLTSAWLPRKFSSMSQK